MRIEDLAGRLCYYYPSQSGEICVFLGVLLCLDGRTSSSGWAVLIEGKIKSIRVGNVFFIPDT